MNMRKMFSVGATCLLLAGCGDAFTPDGIAGTYSLTSVNGIAMPASISITEDGTSVTLTFTSGSLTLRADGTYLFTLATEVAIDGQTVTHTETDSGTYNLQEPSTITVTSSDDGEVSTAILVGGTITVIDDEDGIVATLIFEKQ